MKLFFLTRCVCVTLILGSLLPVSSNQVVAAPSYLAQSQSNYNQYMQLGYGATRQRNYSAALKYFKQALQERPRDRYATAAVRNIELYISRDRRNGSERKTYVTYIPSNLGKPMRQIQGATRGPANRPSETGAACIQGNKSLKALIPAFDLPRTTRTTAANPTFFFYVPQTSAPVMELVLSDEQDNIVYEVTLPTPNKAGIVSLNMPVKPTVPSLKVDKTYKWYFSLICDRRERQLDFVVFGSIERIAPDATLKTALEKVKPEEKAAIYALSGFWQDSLAILSELRKSSPNDMTIKNDWEDLLRSGGLEEITQEPLVPCCTIQ
ncbi:DUF928 domain-containing protein [Fortiea sp. LEGE XX443]|uniref:DUF928 domain-containing protein n=1 Tax=Fortiea sp. LEGE XX443 TaxID=1828611 RepID=UPI0018816C36|nr:DUF928 domain-containing protein [Fortiea sp. LEGE XX443]MBE9005827.1 DUF928 domain-containing protein [Fortiea sp. LEGE XX443]